MQIANSGELPGAQLLQPKPRSRWSWRMTSIIPAPAIGTDLMIKVMRTSHMLQMSALAGIDVNSDRLARGPSASVCLPRTKDSKVSASP
jgi:acetaldehyde dehydrogenase (acetylating)